jgi:hypothetical protein
MAKLIEDDEYERLKAAAQQLEQAQAHHKEHHQQEETLQAAVESNLALMQEREEWENQVRALLDQLDKRLPGPSDFNPCLSCSAAAHGYDEDAGEWLITHQPDCALIELRAFLAREEDTKGTRNWPVE